VFYCDPPYVPTAKEYYGKQFTVDDLRDLASMLTTIKGKFLLKLNDRSYSYIQDILPEDKYVVEHIELPLYHQVKKKENRDKGYRARIRNHGHSCFLCEIVIRSQFHTTYEPEA
jgi:hypothetical protein